MSRAQFQRAMGELTHGAAISRESNRALLAVDALQEIIHSFQLPIAGTAPTLGSASAWGTVDIVFDVEFVDATEQRDSPFVEPNFEYGAVLDVPVMLTACVTAWLRADGRPTSIIGATVAFGVLGNGEVFKGHLHCSFQGYGAASTDNNIALDVGT